MDEPDFIRHARRSIAEEAQGRPDAHTYQEAGNAALNMVLAQWLNTTHLNPGPVIQRKVQVMREWCERRLQQAANKLHHSEQERQQLQASLDKLHLEVAGVDKETGLPIVEALRRARDQGRTWKHEMELARKALLSGAQPAAGKRVVNARTERVREENLKLHQRVRELEAQLVNNS